MKKILLALLTVASIGMSGLAYAQGMHVTGTVTTTDTSCSGAMNNRYNTAVTTSSTYIYANGFANSSVSFTCHDGDGNTFSCYVPTTSALYSAAVDIKNNLTNGGFLYAAKGTTSTECTAVYLLNGSYWLD
jgi:hypothetical protein